jgi:hypothetical protein
MPLPRGATMKRPNALKFYDGPSEIDGAPIVGVISGLVRPTSNRKTGDLFQTWIMPRDVKPNEAVKTGEDVSVCGDCIMRPILHRATPKEKRPCYVKTGQGPRSVWQGMKGEPVATLAQLVNAPNRVTGIRFGAWGEPTAIPLHAWFAVIRILADTVDKAMNRILPTVIRSPGYTHRWDVCDPRWARYLMASVHTEDERQRAKGRGFRTFRIVGSASEVGQGEILCPYTTHGVQCVDCGLCDGSTTDHTLIGGGIDGRKDIAIVVHR